MVTHDYVNAKEIIVNKLTVNTSASLADSTLTRTSQTYMIPANAGKVGATAGFTTNNNTGTVKCPASQTASTFVIPIPVQEGMTITGFNLSGQIESAGNTITVDADLRATTAAAGALTDASIGAITQISKTGDYLVNDGKASLTETTTAGKSYYVLVTCTSAAATDLDLQSVELSVTEA